VLRGVVDSVLPLVLKPRRCNSSQDTELISDEEQLRAAVAVSASERMLLEGYILDPNMPQTGAGTAPYVFVELISSSGMVDVLGISSRTPLAPPLRETGFLLPAGGALTADLAAAAVQAVQAFGVEIRALHVGLKCTDDGPVIIEVNGRPGGAGVHFRVPRGATSKRCSSSCVSLPVTSQCSATSQCPTECSSGSTFNQTPISIGLCRWIDLSLRYKVWASSKWCLALDAATTSPGAMAHSALPLR
jgi:hypothetical protein